MGPHTKLILIGVVMLMGGVLHHEAEISLIEQSNPMGVDVSMLSMIWFIEVPGIHYRILFSFRTFILGIGGAICLSAGMISSFQPRADAAE